MLLEPEVSEPGTCLSDRVCVEDETCVGINVWVVDLGETFQPEVEAFSPERWLPYKGESEEDYSRVEDASAASDLLRWSRCTISHTVLVLRH